MKPNKLLHQNLQSYFNSRDASCNCFMRACVCVCASTAAFLHRALWACKLPALSCTYRVYGPRWSNLPTDFLSRTGDTMRRMLQQIPGALM